MTFGAYQEQARRTQNPNLTREERRNHALFGLASECGEILGIYQKRYQGHSAPTDRVVDELGDMLWFAAELCDVLDIDMDDVAQHNADKLRARYPRGFSAERSLHREG